MTQHVEAAPTLTLAPHVRTQAARRKRSEKDLEVEIAKRQRITLGKDKSKSHLDYYSQSVVSVGGSTSNVGSTISPKEVSPRHQGALSVEGLSTKNPGGTDQVAAKVVSPTVQGAFPVEGRSKKNPGGTNQVAAKVESPVVRKRPQKSSVEPRIERKEIKTGGLPSKRLSFMERVKRVLSFPASPISPSPFKCELTEEDAESNLKLLLANEGSIGKVIESAAFSHMSIGSEFKPPDILEPFLSDHPSWPQPKERLSWCHMSYS